MVLHVLEADIPKDTGIVNENINSTKILDSGIDDSVALLNTVVIRNRLASSGFDFGYDDICGLKVTVC